MAVSLGIPISIILLVNGLYAPVCIQRRKTLLGLNISNIGFSNKGTLNDTTCCSKSIILSIFSVALSPLYLLSLRIFEKGFSHDQSIQAPHRMDLPLPSRCNSGIYRLYIEFVDLLSRKNFNISWRFFGSRSHSTNKETHHIRVDILTQLVQNHLSNVTRFANLFEDDLWKS